MIMNSYKTFTIRLYGQYTMESTLAAAFGSQVNILKGEGDTLSEAAKGLVGQFNDNIIVWTQILSCKYNPCHSHEYNAVLPIVAQFPVFVKSLGFLLGGFLPVFKHFHFISEVCRNIILIRREQKGKNQVLYF